MWPGNKGLNGNDGAVEAEFLVRLQNLGTREQVGVGGRYKELREDLLWVAAGGLEGAM